MQEAITFLIEKEVVFKKLYAQHGHPNVPKRPEGFQTLCKLILEQQVSLESARACYVKIEQALGEVTPELINVSSDELLRSCGVSRQKISYLKALAVAVLDKKLVLETFSEKHPDQVRSELIRVKGIGHWTIDVYLMFSLQAPDIFPIGDIALVNTVKELFGCKDKTEMLALSEHWKPYRSMATHFFWHHYLQKRNRKFIY